MRHSSSTTTTAAVAVATLVTLIGIWIPYSKWKWERRLAAFTEIHSKDTASNDKKDILLVINPASGGGRAMDIYHQVLQALKKTQRDVQVIITKSAHHLQSIATDEIDNLGDYQAIAIMGGDSTLAEFVQATLSQHNGKWPLEYPPIVHLPGGTGNAIASECFGPKADVEGIINACFAPSGTAIVRRASVIQVSSPNTSDPTRYAVHNVFDGVQRHMINALDRRRSDWYPAFGNLVVIPTVMASLLFTYHPQELRNRKYIPHFAAINTDTEGFGIQLGFGIDRCDEYMMVSSIIDPDQWPGSFVFFKEFNVKIMKGELAKVWRKQQEAQNKNQDEKADEKLPSWLTMGKMTKYTVEGVTPTQQFDLYFDGSGTMPFRGTLPFTIKVIPNAIPYFYASTSKE